MSSQGQSGKPRPQWQTKATVTNQGHSGKPRSQWQTKVTVTNQGHSDKPRSQWQNQGHSDILRSKVKLRVCRDPSPSQ